MFTEAMFLSSDALPSPSLNSNISETILNEDILRKIEDDLDIDEKISILFLIISDYTHSFKEIYALLEKYRAEKAYILTEFVARHPDNWKKKLLEAICVIQNRQIIRKLGLSFKELDILHLSRNRLCSRYLNLVAKCLYALCEELSEERTKLLLQYVRSDLNEYEQKLKDTDILELHILYWMQQNYISIQPNGKVKLSNLLKHLKKFKDVELIYEDLRNYDNQQDVLDVQHIKYANTGQLQTFSMRNSMDALAIIEEEDTKKLHRGLCIIISQMFFQSQKFETRFGTSADCLNLSDTFKGFGFTIKSFSNLKKDEILEKLENISKEFGTDYDCVFVCILSHGCKGGIISFDEEEVSIEAIEHKICCVELKDVVKVVIIQACQGKLTEQTNNNLSTEGPVNANIPNILAYRNFCIFMSTMQGFVSVRHKEEGSWFIQELCKILQNEGGKLTFLGMVRKTIHAVMNKRGKLNGTDSIAQLPELRSCRLLSDFYLPEYRANK